jgi:hypothetical protein
MFLHGFENFKNSLANMTIDGLLIFYYCLETNKKKKKG